MCGQHPTPPPPLHTGHLQGTPPDPAAVSVTSDGAHSDCLDPAALRFPASGPCWTPTHVPFSSLSSSGAGEETRTATGHTSTTRANGVTSCTRQDFCAERASRRPAPTPRTWRPVAHGAMWTSVPLPHVPVCEPRYLPGPCLPLSENASVQHDPAERAAPRTRGGGSTQAPPARRHQPGGSRPAGGTWPGLLSGPVHDTATARRCEAARTCDLTFFPSVSPQ